MSTPKRPALNNAIEIATHSTLKDIGFLEESARHFDGHFEEASPPSLNQQFSTEFNLMVRADESTLHARLSVRITTQNGEVRSEAVGQWDFDNKYSVSDEAAFDFGNRVSVFALFPYLRESVHLLSARVLREPLLLPTVRQGEMSFGQKPAQSTGLD
ncbi:hypothetical protein QO003_003548 [Arthrobacter silviterrae]|uniref:Preprotein translocase subunit SecB n=1 Tax=Arthrobacter silviterrae TaxID=2026658 RepID=A0ABX0D9R6_9MICC|nr:hypothetical protein [Arthrobacter silviterrae]MDQ0279245.1 hypothetical protein [Arthrobacter silviterrae]NGN83636.1 hypothetical protein [Arthrobacter silviterrae]